MVLGILLKEGEKTESLISTMNNVCLFNERPSESQVSLST